MPIRMVYASSKKVVQGCLIAALCVTSVFVQTGQTSAAQADPISPEYQMVSLPHVPTIQSAGGPVFEGPASGGGGAGGGAGFVELYFQDQNPLRGQIKPLITWTISDETSYSGYRLEFVDEAETAIRGYDIAKNTGNSYRHTINENEVPGNAIYLDILPKSLDGNLYGNRFRMQIYDLTTDSSVTTVTYSAMEPPSLTPPLRYGDMDSRAGYMNSSIYWYEVSSVTKATYYDLYFVDEHNNKLKPIAEIKRGNLRPYPDIPVTMYKVTLLTGTIIPERAHRIGIFGKNDWGVGTEGSYIGLWDAVENDPGNFYLEDRDPRANRYDQVIRWIPPYNEAYIKNYRLTFYSNMRQVGDPIAVPKGQLQYERHLLPSEIPDDAAFITWEAISWANDTAMLGAYYFIDNILEEHVIPTQTDDASAIPLVSRFLDQDGDPRQIGGDFIFFHPTPHNSDERHFEVYFVDENLRRIKPILKVANIQSGQFSTRIPMNTPIPEGATKIAVYAVSENGASAPATVNIQDGVYSPSLSADQISITNNKEGIPDKIAITGLREWDGVYVYRQADSMNPFLFKTVEPGTNSATFLVPQLGQDAGSLYVSLQRGDGIRSPKTAKAYAAEPKPPVSSGPIYSGGGGVGVPSEPVKWDFVRNNGRLRISSTIEAEPMKKKLADLFQAGGREVPVALTSTAEGYDLRINARLVEEFRQMKKDALLSFTTPVGAVRLPLHVLQDTVRKSGGSDQTNLTLLIDTLPLAEQERLNKSIAREGGTPVGQALTFNLTLKDNNKDLGKIESFAEYVGHCLPLPADFKLNPGEQLVGAVWDPAANSLSPVPLTYSPAKDGKPGAATLWRQGNSIYTVYKSQKKFADVTNGHFAQAAVEALSAAGVIQGFEDGTFRADSDVKRSEFAALLVRALGLRPVKASGKTFSDVSSGDWYASSVQTAVEAGLLSGYEDGTFRPDRTITQQEAVKLIGEAVKQVNPAIQLTAVERNGYLQGVKNSIQVDEWAQDAAALAVKYRILQGSDGFDFRKEDPASRGITVLLIHRLLQNGPWPE